MFIRLIISTVFLITLSCSKKEPEYEVRKKVNPYLIYQEAYQSFEDGNLFFAQKKFTEAELSFKDVEHAAKSAIMATYCFYGINFYTEALANIERYLKKYPADKNLIYAHYLRAVIYFEQISDEKKDIEPLIKAKNEIDFFLKKYPESEYAIDLQFKKDLTINQMAAKELFIAKYYISVQKWIPAVNRLKNIVKNYDRTIFIEEALHRLIEIHYYLGLEEEAKYYAKILGYNYNSSEWFQQSYKILNKDYKIPKINKAVKKDSFLKRIFKKLND